MYDRDEHHKPTPQASSPPTIIRTASWVGDRAALKTPWRFD